MACLGNTPTPSQLDLLPGHTQVHPPDVVDTAWAALLKELDGFPTDLCDIGIQQQKDSFVTRLVNQLVVLQGTGLVDVLRCHILQDLNRVVQADIVPSFWRSFQGSDERRSQGDRENTEGGGKHGKWQRLQYVRVTKAMRLLMRRVEEHLSIVRVLDRAILLATRAGVEVTGKEFEAEGLNSSMIATNSIEDRYRSSLTAQVMACAPRFFKECMRAFFDRNISYWHRQWLERRKQLSMASRGCPSDDAFARADLEMTDAGKGVQADADVTVDGDNTVDSEGEDEGEDDGLSDIDDFDDVNIEEMQETWCALRTLGWFSLLRDTFTNAMYSKVLAYVDQRWV
ncbi:unnamed protein product [Choristocarpus tenellus]